MATVISSIGLKGIEGYHVQVEVQLLLGFGGVSIVGLPSASVKESKDRVMTALYANDCRIFDKKIVINLSPTEQKKNSPIFDLAMAIGIMKESGKIQDPIPEDAAFLGVLSLDGNLKTVDGMLPAIIAARKEGFKILYLPKMDDMTIKYIDGIELRFVKTLAEVINSFSGKLTFSTPTDTAIEPTIINPSTYDKDFRHILGHKQAKRALEVAAAGGHHLLMVGPPGCGKSLLAESFSSILPPLKQESQFDVMGIYQLAGMTKSNYQLPPFREPHHSASAVSLIGGGSNPKPGEISLAHHGVLFLDEMAEFPKRTLDMLRQPIETGMVTISRAVQTVTYPARFTLVGAMNPCPCGYLGARNIYCTCTPKQIKAYNNRISGPIQDRIDILINLKPVLLDQESVEENEPSITIRERVTAARERQYDRYGSNESNAIVSNEKLLEATKLNKEQEQMMRKWASENYWSTRVQMKYLRLARTISDLSGDENITNHAMWEAVTMRRIDLTKQQKGMMR